MRVVTNEFRIKRGKQASTILFFLSLLILMGGMILSAVPAFIQLSLFFVPCLVLPVGLTTTLISMRLTNRYVRQPHPENVLYEGLKGLSKRSILYHYLPLGDHILVAPEGVFTFTIRFQPARYEVKGDQWHDPRAKLLGPLFLQLRQEQLGRPFEEAEKSAAKVQALVDGALPGAGIAVQPAVVFTSPRANVEQTDPKYPVVYADSKKKPSVKSLVREERRKEEGAVLSDDQIETLHEAILDTLTPVQADKHVFLEED